MIDSQLLMVIFGIFGYSSLLDSGIDERTSTFYYRFKVPGIDYSCNVSSADNKCKEESAKLLGRLIRNCERLIRPYIAPIHKVSYLCLVFNIHLYLFI